ncbi:BREX-1 system adenine-specific DNA-methyltransferase PglX [Lentibacillus sp. N15]|uniref:BREX-1 system adenine-specific DNA-methyltransferase PglX n=1 Tax=Lentibacillus songyuanensis TaxID=3136161 RepID=UPI0031BB8285
MNKAELKKFAVEARRDLIEKVSYKAEQYGITKDQGLQIEENFGQLIVNGKTYPTVMKHAFQSLQKRLNTTNYEQLIEEVAYTWFNRIIAIRYMEVNNYLPDRVNVLSSSTGKDEPDILLQYETMNIDIDYQQIKDLEQQENNEPVYRRLFVAQCNALNKILPFLFEKIEDYTQLLLPDYLLDEESIIRKIVHSLSEENFYQLHDDGSRSDNVEVLGWLYQYYMSEKKEKVGGLKNTAVKKEDLPVVTQLFTPKWIVQYMVQNSLGKLYDEKYESNQLSRNWEYYLKHEENHHLCPEFDSLEDLKIIDPACGSGHILLYAFEMLYDMYEETGYPSREIPQLILENNLYGLDIDKRAQQIANFALLMKAAEKQPRFISRLSRKGKSPKLNVYEIVDADQSLSEEAINYFAESETEKSLINELVSQFENGKQFGSLINPIEIPYEEWIKRINELECRNNDLLDESYFNELKDKLLPVLVQALLLFQKYDVVVTNPPYHNKYNSVLKKFMNKEYKNYKSDLYSAFIYCSIKMTRKNGYATLMSPFTWMFISSHEKLRRFIINDQSITSLVQLEYSAFKEATVPICTFVIQNQINSPVGSYIRLSEFHGEDIQPIKVKEAADNNNVDYYYHFNSKDYKYIPESPIAYWASDQVRHIFRNNKLLGDFSEPKVGLQSSDTNRFLKLWHEVDYLDIGFGFNNRIDANNSGKKWFPINKGGGYRKWYGDRDYVVNWENDGFEIRNFKDDKGKIKSRPQNMSFYFREGVTWGKVSSGLFSVRYVEEGFIFSDAGMKIFADKGSIKVILSFLNSKIVELIIGQISETINFEQGNISRLPYLDAIESKIVNQIIRLANHNIEISRSDLDSLEISWGFKKHPFLCSNTSLLCNAFSDWKEIKEEQFKKMKSNEVELNRIFINLYGIEEELEPEVTDEEITLEVANCEKDTKSFLSYFIGCIMGRYSLDVEGFAYAGGNFNESNYETFKPNNDGLIQLTDVHYFDNDIIVRLREFLSVAFSPDTVDENMQWLAESLKMKKNESPEERLRRYFLDDFFKDHCKTYQKRPIYWLVDSGKQKGLRTLIYMHRYQPDTMATIRFEQLQEIQSKYQNEIDMIDTRLANPSLSATDRRGLEKLKTVYQKKIEELQEFDKHLATYASEPIDIDLDDGVNVNYAQFEKVLSKIK